MKGVKGMDARDIKNLEAYKGAKCIGVFDEVPYFIDASGCAFSRETVLRYNPFRSMDILDIFDVLDARDLPPDIKSAYDKAVHERDTQDAAYIEAIHGTGFETLTEERERHEKAARENRTA